MAHIIHQELSDRLLGMAFTVHGHLGPGLLEACYEEAFCVELMLAGVRYERQKVYPLSYKGYDIGGYIADIVVDNAVILELKSVTKLNEIMEAQLLNYLYLSRLQVGYLVNFHGSRVEWKRLVCSGSG